MPASKSLEELRKEKVALSKLYEEQLERQKLILQIAELRKKTHKKGLFEKALDRVVGPCRSDQT